MEKGQSLASSPRGVSKTPDGEMSLPQKLAVYLILGFPAEVPNAAPGPHYKLRGDILGSGDSQ